VPQPKVAHIATVDATLNYLLLSQLRAIQERGYEVVAVSSPGPHVANLRVAGIPHVPVPMARQPAPAADVLSLLRLVQVIREYRFSIVHTHTPKADLLGQLAARIAGVPVVVRTLHGYHFHEHMKPMAYQFYVFLERATARLSDVILSQSIEDIEVAARLRLCPATKIKHLGNGVDLAAFNPDRFSLDAVRSKRIELGLGECTRVVGFVGRLAARRKGFVDFLRAAQQLARLREDVVFLVVGGPDRGKADAASPEMAREYGVWHRCRFLGQRPNAELPALYAIMDVVVLPSLFEGVPRVLMEAAAMGVPVVATDVKGNREAVDHGVNGLLVRLGDVVALGAAIRQILEDPVMARRMGEAGKALARKRFDERVVFRKVLAEYERLLVAKGFSAPTLQASTWVSSGG